MRRGPREVSPVPDVEDETSPWGLASWQLTAAHFREKICRRAGHRHEVRADPTDCPASQSGGGAFSDLLGEQGRNHHPAGSA